MERHPNDTCPHCKKKYKRCDCKAIKTRRILTSSVIVASMIVILGIWLSTRPTQTTAKESISTENHIRPADPNRDQVRSGSLYLKQLVESTPDERVSRELFDWIDSKKLSINFQERPGEEGAFASISYVRDLITDQDRPVLMVAYSGLISDTRSTRFKQLVLLHEYVHGKGLFAALRGERSLQQFRVVKVSDIPSLKPEDQKLVLFDEFEAYTTECEMAKRLGWKGEFELCDTYMTSSYSEFLDAVIAAESHHPVMSHFSEYFEQWKKEYLNK